jgi:general stress protein 26
MTGTDRELADCLPTTEASMSDPEPGSKDRLMTLLKDVGIAMMATRGADGHFHSRPMAKSDLSDPEGALFFLTNDHSGWVKDIARDSETLLTFANESKQLYIALRGETAVITDKGQIKEHWTPSARGWFPKGPDDPEIALLKVTIHDAEYWDAPNGKMVVLLAYAKAAVTGQKPGNIGEHERLSL